MTFRGAHCDWEQASIGTKETFRLERRSLSHVRKFEEKSGRENCCVFPFADEVTLHFYTLDAIPNLQDIKGRQVSDAQVTVGTLEAKRPWRLS